MRTFTLGAGADVVRFTVAANSSTNSDTITNFTVANDKLSFSKTIFTGLGTLTGNLKAVNTQDINVDTSTSGVTTIYKGALNDLKAHLKGAASVDAGKVIVAVATDAGDVGGIYALTLRETDAVTTVAKVGTLTGVALDTLTMANFEAIA